MTIVTARDIWHNAGPVSCLEQPRHGAMMPRSEQTSPEQPHPEQPHPTQSSSEKNFRGYWRSNLRAVLVLLSIWFFVGFVCSIFFIEPLNTIKIGQVGLGFWFAQQGSIFVFVLLVLAYALWMDRLDRKYNAGE